MKDGHSFKVYLVTDILLFYDGDMFVGFSDRSTLWFQNKDNDNKSNQLELLGPQVDYC